MLNMKERLWVNTSVGKESHLLYSNKTETKCSFPIPVNYIDSEGENCKYYFATDYNYKPYSLNLYNKNGDVIHVSKRLPYCDIYIKGISSTESDGNIFTLCQITSIRFSCSFPIDLGITVYDSFGNVLVEKDFISPKIEETGLDIRFTIKNNSNIKVRIYTKKIYATSKVSIKCRSQIAVALNLEATVETTEPDLSFSKYIEDYNTRVWATNMEIDNREGGGWNFSGKKIVPPLLWYNMEAKLYVTKKDGTTECVATCGWKQGGGIVGWGGWTYDKELKILIDGNKTILEKATSFTPDTSGISKKLSFTIDKIEDFFTE